MQNLALNSNYDTMIGSAISVGCRYLEKYPSIDTFVLGISGGIDSAVTAALARRVCDEFTTRKVRLIGVCLYIDGNKKDEMARAQSVGEALCDEFSMVSLDGAFMRLMADLDPHLHAKYTAELPKCTYQDRIRAGNIKARIRMIHLYNLAQANSGLVLSTDNFTELQLGFWTLHGDVGDFGFIQNLWKTEVYGLAEALGEPLTACVEAKPTDGLGVSDSDISQLLPGWEPAEGQTYVDAYRLIDEVLIDYFTHNCTFDLDHPVILRHKASQFKRKNPVNISREILTWVHNTKWVPM